jgi:ribosomal protein L7/L12
VFWKVVLKGSAPSGKILAVLCARTGETIDSMKVLLDSSGGVVLKTGLSRENAEKLKTELQHDSSVQVIVLKDEESCVAVLVGYRPGCRGRLRVALQTLSRLPTEEVIRYLSSIPIALKSNIDRVAAESIKAILERAGGIVEIRTSEGLAGVSSKKSHSTLYGNGTDDSFATAARTSQETDNSSFSDAVPPAAVGTITPPEVGQSNLEKSREFKLPVRIDFSPPGSRPSAIPEVTGDATQIQFHSEPYRIKFTIPGSYSPPVQQILNKTAFWPPDRTESGRIVHVFLFPVARTDRNRVKDVLCGYLDIDSERALQFIDRAPVALAGFSERISALVVLKELFDMGIPVSLVKGSSTIKGTSPGKSFLGWLNGHGRTS